MGFFTHNTCCPCKMPLWVGAFFIGFLELIAGLDEAMMGFNFGWLLLFNSVWFALLFVPSLFYNQNQRKATWMVYGITTVIMLIGTLWWTIGGLISDDLPRDIKKMLGLPHSYIYPEPPKEQPATETTTTTTPAAEPKPCYGIKRVGVKDDSTVPMEPNMYGGDRAGLIWVFNAIIYNTDFQEHETLDCMPKDSFDKKLTTAFWSIAFMMWVSLFVRIFFQIVLVKFCEEASWITKNKDAEEVRFSHPCRQC